MDAWDRLNRRIIRCHACPRLRDFCAATARRKRRAFASWTYWGRPVPNFGDPQAELLVVGLAPAAHGANRTGRMFTGDRSGQWLFRALHRVGLASQAEAVSRDDGLELRGCAITAVCHCAPPQNKPTRDELVRCRRWLAETAAVVQPRVILALGRLAWDGTADLALELGWRSGPRPRFAHGAVVQWAGPRWLVGAYHPSQQNTFTGRLTEAMLDAAIGAACRLAWPDGPRA